MAGDWFLNIRNNYDDNLIHRCSMTSITPLKNKQGYFAREYGLRGL